MITAVNGTPINSVQDLRSAAERAKEGIAVLVRRGAAGRRTTLPYVPALAAGAVIGLFFGDAIHDAWLG